MTDKQHENLCNKLDKEFDEFKAEMLKLSPEELFEEHYKISAMYDIYCYLEEEGSTLNFKGIPKKNILWDFYHQFMSSAYELSHEDIDTFIKEQVDYNIRYCEEM